MRDEKNSTGTMGGCLCGAVRYEVSGPLRAVVNCHCGQCRHTSGHFVAATAVRPKAMTLIASEGLRWYQSSDTARRGFCQNCGSSLFWEPVSGEKIVIMAGTLDGPTGLRTAAHIFVGDAGDYYEIDDDLPRFASGDHGVEIPDG
ncbi:MAG: GFA family protein [Rubrobacteraceae bacterium]|nr:GFA family protein [Rubrobacter sp.]